MILPLAALAAAAWATYRAKPGPMLDPSKFTQPQSKFAASLYNVAAPLCASAGAPVALALAQAAIETGWGKSIPANNLYGLKGTGPAGSVTVPTTEERTPGEVTRESGKFRAFANWADSVKSWCNYVTAPRNRPPVPAPSPGSWLAWYWAQGYATAARYPQTVAAVSRSVASRLSKPELAITLSPAVAAVVADLSALPARQRPAAAKALAAKGAWPSK
jgi:flagellum-specific peptidoglycan hydrolase FlgJ